MWGKVVTSQQERSNAHWLNQRGSRRLMAQRKEGSVTVQLAPKEVINERPRQEFNT
jgi:hypothetical protein